MTVMTVFPVCAGMSPINTNTYLGLTRFPRMRGDEPTIGGRMKAGTVFSPYARG